MGVCILWGGRRMSKDKKVYEELSDMFDLKRDVGFQSRFSLMSPDYIPLVDRVKSLEEEVKALKEHLGVDIVRKNILVVPKEKK